MARERQGKGLASKQQARACAGVTLHRGIDALLTCVRALPMPLVVDEITYILAATGISVGTLAMLATSFPAALVPAAIRRMLILSVNSAP